MIKVYTGSKSYYLLVNETEDACRWEAKDPVEMRCIPRNWWTYSGKIIDKGELMGEIEAIEDLQSTLKMWGLLDE